MPSTQQAAGDVALTPASDIFSVGVLAYYLLSGKVPFVGRSAMQMLAAHMYERPVPLSAHGVSVSPSVEAAVFRCLEKEPAARFGSAKEAANALTQGSTDGA